jgi:succinate-acetate transporter protein
VLHSIKAGGALRIIMALIAYYIGLTELLTSEEMSIMRLLLSAFKKD